MGKRQRVFFGIGTWACIATAAIHMVGQLAGNPAPQNPTEEALFKLLTTYQKDFGAGFHRTTSDFLNGFSISFSLLLLWVGVLCLVLARSRGDEPALLRTVSGVCAVLSGLLLIVSVAYFFLPPTACLAVVFLGFAGAALSPAGAVRA